jgi:hypothetical protein
MATIYNAPKNLTVPTDFSSDTHSEDCEQYLADLKAHVKQLNPRGKHGGEIIKFPAADSYAEYMVVRLKPLELVHIPLWDAWHFPYAHLLTAKEVSNQIESTKKFQAFLDSRK